MAEAVHELKPTQPEEERAMKVVQSGIGAGDFAGLGAVVLAILGLAGLLPLPFLAIGVIAVGVGIFTEGASVSAEYSKLIAAASGAEREVVSGTSAEVMGGAASVVLGILGLIGVVPMTLLSCASIVLGATLLFSMREISRLGSLSLSGVSPRYLDVAGRAVESSTGAQALVGIGSIALGILALLGLSPLTLNLIVVLSVGASLLLSSAILGRRLGTAIRV